MGPSRCFRKRHDSLLITSKESQFTIQFFHYRLPLCPVQLRAVSWGNIVAKSNKFPFPMILVWDRKWVNIARYSVEDHLIGWWVGRRTHFVSGRQTVGRPRERPRRTRRRFFLPWGKTSVSSVRSEADRTPDGVKKRLKRGYAIAMISVCLLSEFAADHKDVFSLFHPTERALVQFFEHLISDIKVRSLGWRNPTHWIELKMTRLSLNCLLVKCWFL